MKNQRANQLISVIVPVYNTAKTLEATLNSLLRQDEDVTEIICVDDCSTDDSRAILKRYADFAQNIKVIYSNQNEGTLAARKHGVEAANGKYIMFLDSDDCLTDDACAYLSERMQSTGADVLNFAAELVAMPGVSDSTIMCVKEVLRSVPGLYENTSLLDEVFVRKNISMNLWNKIYRAEIVKRAYACAPSGRFLYGEDIFITFLCMYHAQRMICEDRVCYRYSVGSGISTTTGVTLQRMETFCSVSVLVEKVRAFLEDEKCFDIYQDAWNIYSNMMFSDCLHKWLDLAEPSMKAATFEVLQRAWGASRVFRYLIENNHGLDQQAAIADMLVGVKSLHAAPRKVKTIGLFYYRTYNGGLERVAAHLANMWVSMGYRVVFYMDYPVTQDTYFLDPKVKTVLLPDSFSPSSKEHIHRFEKFSKCLQEDGVDVLVHHAWLSECLLWDILAAKVQGIPVIMHTHGVFSSLFKSDSEYYHRQFFQLQHIYHLVDAVITLSNADKAYWKNFAGTVYTMHNPCSMQLPEAPVKRIPHSILCVGRISLQKNMIHAVEILSLVRKQVKDATLIIVGKADTCDAEYKARLVSRVKELELEDAVTFAGFQTDVAKFYMASDVYLCTSSYEGFPISIAESKIAGLPCVMFDMPYLTFAEQNKGVIIVPQNDNTAAANALISLLQNPDELQHLAKEAKESASILDNAALQPAWRDVFSAFEKELPMWKPGNTPESVMMQTMMSDMYASRVAPYAAPAEAAQPAPEPLPAMLRYKGPAKKLVTLVYYLKKGGILAAAKAYVEAKERGH